MDRCQAFLAIGFALFFLQTLSCHAAVTGTGAVTNNEAEGCQYNDEVRLDVGSEYVVDECTTCTCPADRDLRCESLDCPAIFCDQLIKFDGQCCDVCPYYLPVWRVNIQQTQPTNIIEGQPIWKLDVDQPLKSTNIIAGQKNTVTFDLTISVRGGGARVIAGDGLLKVSAFTSEFGLGYGERVGRVEQVLTDEQANRDIINPNFSDFEYTIDGIEYVLDATDLSCSQMVHFCVEIAKGDNPILQDPRLTFTIEGVSSRDKNKKRPNVLTRCNPFRSCQASTTEEISGSCTYRGTLLAVGGEYVVDECTTCVCRSNNDVRCDIRSCPSIFCDEPISVDGECCDICPYYLPVWKVQPSDPPAISAGISNIVNFDLVYQVSRGSNRVIPGDGLIKVSAWAAENADGSGHRVGFNEQILTDEQANRDITHDSFFTPPVEQTIDGIEFTLDASDATCSQMEYLCVELAKGDNPTLNNPRLPFFVEGVANADDHTVVQSNLIGCTPFSTCNASEVADTALETDTDSTSSDTGILPCRYKNSIIIHGGSKRIDDCTVCTCDNSTVVCNIQSCPVIACSDGQEPVAKDNECCESCPDPSTAIDVLTSENYEGCIYIYRDDIRVPVGGVYEIDPCTSCVCEAVHDMRCEIRSCPSIFCKQPITLDDECCKVCPYYLPVWNVQPSDPPAITAGTLNNVVFDLVIHTNRRVSHSINGDGLIKVSAFASDGKGNHVGYKDQVLTNEQADNDITVSTFRDNQNDKYEYRINGIEFALDASAGTCSEMKYLCVELAEGDNSTLNNPRIPLTVEGVAGEDDDTEAPDNLLGCISFPSCEANEVADTALENDTDSTSSDTGILPCRYKNSIIIHGGLKRIDDCTVCTCDNSTVVCNIQSCPVIACSDGQEPVAKDNECCESCPDPSTAIDVLTSENYEGCIYIYRDDIRVPVGGVYEIDPCTSCVCEAVHDMRCEIRSCPSIFCKQPITLDDECCKVCPYYLPVWNVQPSDPPAITAGTLNNVVFDLVIHTNRRVSHSINGDGLIKVSAFASDGKGNRVGYKDQVLTNEQADNDITVSTFRDNQNDKYEYRINGIEFALDASAGTCSEMKYLCVELTKGDNSTLNDPRIPFTVESVAGEDDDTEAPGNLLGCISFPSCEDPDTETHSSFSVAKKTGQIASEPAAILGWSDEFNNVGGAFDSKTGLFTSPDTGSYFFIYQIMEIPNAQSSVVRLMKNDKVALAGSFNSNHIILDLEVGDTVWLQLQGELVSTSERFSTFSGFLI